MQLINLIGRQFGRLIVIERGANIGPHVAYKCQCECGNITTIRSHSLLRDDTKSCGCIRSEKMKHGKTIHGFYNTPTYHSYRAMIARCTDIKHKQYKDYGGRGIIICESWLQSFQNFLTDMGKRPEGTTLDRKDNDDNYYKENCKWATRIEQNNNKRKKHGTESIIS